MKPSRIDRICEQCGGVFKCHLYRLKAGQGRFCSRICYARSPASIAIILKAKAAQLLLLQETSEQRLWAKVDIGSEDACWEWTGSRTHAGYGQSRWYGKQRTVHSIVCELTHGPKPTPKHQVAHSCGVRACCNPRHLRWATASENQMDRVLHGTHNRGERQGQSKLTTDQVREIRAQPHRLQRDLAAEYGVTDRTIGDIQRREIWRHIP